MKKVLAIFLALIMCASFGVTLSNMEAQALSSHVYMIVTNPGENCNTQMNISWHSDFSYKNCYVEYTVASDTAFANSKTKSGTYDSDDYEWFYNHLIGLTAGGAVCTLDFLNWGAELTGLTPDTDYIYRVWDAPNGAYSKTYKFKTSGAKEFSILWMSDAHVNNSYPVRLQNWKDTVDYAETVAAYDIGFQFSTGDTLASGDRYYDWLSTYESDFIQDYMFANLLGNHDSYDAAMETSANYTQYWKSSEYFRIVNNYPKNAYTQNNVRITTYLGNDGLSQYAGYPADALIPYNGALKCTGAAEDVNGKSYWFLYDRCLFIMFDYWTFYYSNAEKLRAFEWAGSVIEANEGKYDYLICADHNNLIWGAGGGDRYYEYFRPLMDQYNVDMFLAGDNHVYLRTASLYNGQVNTDPEKGTYIIQAPCLSRGPSFVGTGAAGYAVNQYANGSTTVGGIVIDVNSTGMTFTCVVKENGSYRKFESFTVPKKVRYSNVETGYYNITADTVLRETYDPSSRSLTTIPANTIVEVTDSDGLWGRIRYNGFTGWALVGSFEKVGAPASVTAPAAFPVNLIDATYSSASTMQVFTPAYGATIASGSWSYMYLTALTAVKNANGAYEVTTINSASEAKNNTAIPANGVVLLFANAYAQRDALLSQLAIGSFFTVDSNGFNILPANPGETNPVIVITNPDDEQPLVINPSSGYTLNEGVVSGAAASTTVDSFKAGFSNTGLVTIHDANGAELTGGDIVGTGCVIKSFKSDNTTVSDSATIVIRGDCSGDGLINTVDYIQIKLHVKNTTALASVYFTAADVDSTGVINSTDYIQFKLHVKGTQLIGA